MGGDPDLITEEMRPVNAQSFGLIYTSPLMLLTHRLATEEFRRRRGRRVNASSVWTLYFYSEFRKQYNRLVSKLLHKSVMMIVQGARKILAGKMGTAHLSDNPLYQNKGLAGLGRFRHEK